MKQVQKLVYLTAVSFLFVGCGETTETTEISEQLKPLVTGAPAMKKDFEHRIHVPGNVETDQDVLITAEMGGLVTAINVKEGQKVSAGQVIAQIDASVLSSNVQELQTQLKFAEYMLKKQEELHRRGVGTELELESAQNQVNSLKASIQSLDTQRGKALIKAPFSGTIDQVFAKKGQMAGASTPVVRLVNNNSIDITASISEKYFDKVVVGTPVIVSFPHYSDTSIQLPVDYVGNYIEPTNRTFRIKSTLNNNNYFLPNMLAELTITDMKVKDGLVVPSEAIMKDQNNKDYLFKLVPLNKKSEDGSQLYKAVKMDVTVIESYNGESLIKKNGIQPKDMIAVKGAKGIINDEVVRIK
ncbi:MAG: efflux RND transporter periplasmic adaptor subunit [Bacteroidetes bacterium]|nr:MAG: efflux RND transporter periplasmic adaptor subunit [Bacteroidota bacterium]